MTYFEKTVLWLLLGLYRTIVFKNRAMNEEEIAMMLSIKEKIGE